MVRGSRTHNSGAYSKSEMIPIAMAMVMTIQTMTAMVVALYLLVAVMRIMRMMRTATMRTHSSR